jgi:hypothetical protein
MWQVISDWYYAFVWGIDRCGQGPDRWGEQCGGGTSGTDYQDISWW